MLARKHKLDPADLFARPHQTLRAAHLGLAYAKAQGKEGQFAVIISAKVAPSAVLRHRVKRALYDESRKYHPFPYDVAVSVRNASGNDLLHILHNEYQELISRITKP